MNGVRHGHWTEKDYTVVSQGPYRNGGKHGFWIERHTESGFEATSEGWYQQRSPSYSFKCGRWKTTFANGQVQYLDLNECRR